MRGSALEATGAGQYWRAPEAMEASASSMPCMTAVSTELDKPSTARAAAATGHVAQRCSQTNSSYSHPYHQTTPTRLTAPHRGERRKCRDEKGDQSHQSSGVAQEGASVLTRKRPIGFHDIIHALDLTNVKKPASQRKFVSVVHHAEWLGVVADARDADAAALAAGTTTRRHREVTRVIAASQPYSGSWLGLQPTAPDVRQRSDEWLWAAQRRFGLNVSQACAVFVMLGTSTGDHYDALGDRITHDVGTDKSAPHHAVLRTLHAASQATASHQVVLGDKSTPEAYSAYNATPANGGTVVDLAEPRMGKGGADLCVEP